LRDAGGNVDAIALQNLWRLWIISRLGGFEAVFDAGFLSAGDYACHVVNVESPGEQHSAFHERPLSGYQTDQAAGLRISQRLHRNVDKKERAEWRVPLADHPRLIDEHP
jgi:hypothetical protein